MTLKLIPSEYQLVNLQGKKQKSILKTIRKKIAYKKTKTGQLAIKKSCCFLMNFLSCEGNMQIQDMNELIKNLEKSIIIVQASKKKLIEKKNKKQK